MTNEAILIIKKLNIFNICSQKVLFNRQLRHFS